MNQLERLLQETYDPTLVFEPIKSKWYLDKFLKNELSMISAEPLTLGVSLKWKRNQEIPHLEEVKEEVFIIPFLKSLQNLLLNKEIRDNINQTNCINDGVLRTVLDGTYYRENEVFRQMEKPLAVILYYDEVGIANPLGSHSTTQKLGMFYWTLANIDPKLRTSQNSIFLLAIVKAKLIKKFGLEKLLKPFIDDIKILRTRGISVTVDGEELLFKGSLLFCAGDTPASAFLGGFKESVSSIRLCRTCLVRKEEWKSNFMDDFTHRSAESHREHVEAVTDQTASNVVSSFWKRRYGVNSKSALFEIMDVTKCLPQDAMHLFPEGVTEVTTRAILWYFIVDKELLTVEELNEKIENFDFHHFKNNKPGVILRDHIRRDSKLKQSASQTLALAHCLPFLLNEWIIEENIEHLEHILLYVSMLQIVNVCFSYEIHLNTTYVLARMIKTFNLKFKRLFPEWLVPKFHFVTHLPENIRMFGPARQQWCFGFEREHGYFKQLVPVVRSFKNMSLTLCYRHQARLCSQLATFRGRESKKFLYQGDEITLGQRVLLRNLPHMRLLLDFVPQDEIETFTVSRCVRVKSHGTKYKEGSVILLECDENSLPIFGVIKEIFVVGDIILFCYLKLDTIHYKETLNSYKINQPCIVSQNVIRLKDLLFPHPIPQFEFDNSKYVILLDHERTEFYG